jgi:hypothetical protein
VMPFPVELLRFFERAAGAPTTATETAAGADPAGTQRDPHRRESEQEQRARQAAPASGASTK